MLVRAVVFGLLVSGCGPTKSQLPTPTAEQEPQITTVAPFTEAQALAILPTSATVVGSIDAADWRNTPLWKRYNKDIKSLLRQDGEYVDFVKRCQFDPLAGINRLWFGGKGDDEDTFVIVLEGVPRRRLSGCMRQKAQVRNGLITIDDFTIGFIGETVAVISTTEARVNRALARNSKLGANSELRTIRSRMVSDRSWFVVLEIPEDITRNMPLPIQIDSAFASVNGQRGVAITSGAFLKDESQANMMVGMMNMGIGQMRTSFPNSLHESIDKFKVSNEGALLTVSLALEMDDIGAIDQAIRDGSLPF